MPVRFPENGKKVPAYSKDGEEENAAKGVYIFLHGVFTEVLLNLL